MATDIQADLLDLCMDAERLSRELQQGRAVLVARRLGALSAQLDLLSAGEQHRTARFAHPQDREAFVKGRTLVRQVMGSLLGTVSLSIGPHGKPECADPRAPAFNLSHASGVLVAVFSPCGPVGVDVERRDRKPKRPQALAAKVFSHGEQRAYLAGESEFLPLWTRKEAVLKAMGSGFAAGAGSVDAVAAAHASAWRIEEFRLDEVLGAVCIPERVRVIYH